METLNLPLLLFKLHRNGKFFIINLCRIWGDTLNADIQDRIMTMKETKGRRRDISKANMSKEKGRMQTCYN
jgi:hypothetical protein